MAFFSGDLLYACFDVFVQPLAGLRYGWAWLFPGGEPGLCTFKPYRLVNPAGPAMDAMYRATRRDNVFKGF